MLSIVDGLRYGLNAHKITEQNPKSAAGFAADRNFDLDTYFPRSTPSTSIPVLVGGACGTAFSRQLTLLKGMSWTDLLI